MRNEKKQHWDGRQRALDKRAGSGHDAPAGEEMLAEQRKWLEQLRAQEDEVRTLRERECELEVEVEVEHIAADAALNTASLKGVPDLDLGRAAEIAEALDRKRELQAVLGTLERRSDQGGDANASELERLTAGRDALISWLEAPRTVRPPRLPRMAHRLLLAAAVAAVWAALAVHPILLLLLVPLAVPPLTFLSLSREDLAWLRLGAERRFRETGFKPPATWEEATVRDRVSELEGVMDAVSQRMGEFAETEEMEGGDHEAVAAELAQAKKHLEAVLTKVGLDADSIDGELGRWLGLVSQARRAREALEKVKAARGASSAETDDVREDLFRFLSRQGEPPRDGCADLDALAAALERVAARSVSRDRTGDGPSREGDREI